MRRFLATLLLIVFVSLMTTDTFACPDGCQNAATAPATDHSKATGTCVFCSGGAVMAASDIAVVSLVRVIRPPDCRTDITCSRPRSVDRPPRTI